MSKKMKGVAFDSSPRVDARARFKHQTLIQDYLELQQETKAARNQLEEMKQKKQTLEAEVRFLRRRHKFLLKSKSPTSQQMKSQYIETTRYRKIKKDKVNPKKAATLPNFPPNPNLIQKGKMHTRKKNIIPNRPTHTFDFDFDRNVNPHGVVDLNQMIQKENGFSGKETAAQTRAPIFDLNQISMEEEAEVQQNDLKRSICRNVGDGSTHRSGKRKISWQDPVALRV